MEPRFDNLKREMDEFCREFLAEVRRLVKEEDGLASGKMYDDFDCKPVKENGHYTIYLYHTDYFKYYDEGTSPHWAPIQPLKDWVAAKQRNGMLPEVPGLPYMVQWKIARDGTEGRDVFERACMEVIPRYEGRFADALAQDFIDNYLNGYNIEDWQILKI